MTTLTMTPELQYDTRVTLHRHSPYMDYPHHVHFETQALCNAACNFCPYPQLDRKGSRMSDALIEKVVNDLQEIPQNIPFQISPLKVSEPFLEKRLFNIMRLINDKLPNAELSLTSNATPITEQKLSMLSHVQNLAYLWISFNDHRPAEYEQTMKLPYARTIEKLDLIHSYKSTGRLNIQTVLSRVGDKSAADEEFCQWVKTHYPLFSPYVFTRGGWLGQVKTNEETVREVPNTGCLRWFELSITATGQVAHCCMDGNLKYPIGDITTQHVLEVYNAPHYRKLRERTVSRRHVDPCNQCTFE